MAMRVFGPTITGTSTIITRAEGVQQGTREPTYRQTYQIELSDKAPADVAIRLAQRWEPNPLPRRGQTFRHVIGSHTYTNRAVFAFGFIPYRLPGITEDFPQTWMVDVLYREPVWGQDEVPRTAHLDPPLRASESKWDWVNATTQKTEGYPVKGSETALISDDDKMEPMLNPAGLPITPEPVSQRILVARILYNSTNMREAIQKDRQFSDTVNKYDFWLMGERIKRHHARYQSCEQVHGGYYGDGFRYNRCELRLEIGDKPFLIRRKAVGTTTYADIVDPTASTGAPAEGERNIDTDDSGVPTVGEVPLTESGAKAEAERDADSKEFKADTFNQAEQKWLGHKPVSYSTIRTLA